MKRSVSQKKKIVRKPVNKKVKTIKKIKKSVKKMDKFFVEENNISDKITQEKIIEDIFEAENKKNQKVFMPNFLNESNPTYDLDELLSEVEIIKEKDAFEYNEISHTLEVPENIKKNHLEKMIMDDVVMSETLRMGKNFNIKLKEENNIELNRLKQIPQKSKHIVNLKHVPQNNEINVNDEKQILFEIPQKPTIKSLSSLYIKQITYLASRSKTFKFIHFIGKGTTEFFSYIFLGIFFIFKSIFSLFAETFLLINSIGKGIIRFFVISSKKDIREEFKQSEEKIKTVRKKIFSINPNQLFAKGAFSHYQRVFSFATISIAIIAIIHFLPIINNLNNTKGKVLGISEQAYANFGDGINSMMGSDFSNATNNFLEASANFSEAQKEISQYNTVFIEMLKLIPEEGKKVDYGIRLLEAGEAFSNAANHISEALSEKNNLSITDKIKLVSESIRQTKDQIKIANKNIENIDVNSLPEEYREKFQFIKDNLPKLSNNLDTLLDLMDASLEILADNSMKRYLFVFQNNNELRPTGGFMGSIAIVDIKEGKIANMKIPGGGPYDYKAGFFEKIISPDPMRIIAPNLNFWDAMWWSDFPTSSDMMLKYFYKSGGPTVDGVISINSDVMKNLLEVTGPIYLEKYGIAITPENFYKEIQTEVELNYDREKNQPKAVIGDLADIVLKRVFEDKTINYLDILKVFENSTSNKDIQMYFTNTNLEEKVKKLGWAGQVVNTSKDYLSVIDTNIGGGKTDAYINQQIKHDVNILANGKIVDRVEIIRSFQKQENDRFANNKNRNYIRIYVPRGSKILQATGFENFPENEYIDPVYGSIEDKEFFDIDGRYLVDEQTGVKINESFDKTVFSGWQEIEPGQSKNIVISYELPFTLSFGKNKSWISSLFFKNDKSLNLDSYSVYYQKQSGIDSQLNTNYIFSNKGKIVWSSFTRMQNVYNFDKDIVGGFILENNN